MKNKLSEIARHYVTKQLRLDSLSAQLKQIDEEIDQLVKKQNKLRDKYRGIEHEQGKLNYQMAKHLSLPTLVHVTDCEVEGTFMLIPVDLRNGEGEVYGVRYVVTPMAPMTIERYEETFMNEVPF